MKLIFDPSRTTAYDGYLNAKDVWQIDTPANSNSLGSACNNQHLYQTCCPELLQFPWPLADQSVQAVKLEWNLELIEDHKTWLAVWAELHRVCTDGALIEFKLHSPEMLETYGLMRGGVTQFLNKVNRNTLLFLDKTVRQSLAQQYWEGMPLFPEFNASFKLLNFEIVLNEDVQSIAQKHNLSNSAQLSAFINQHPELISHYAVSMCAVQDESHHFALAKVNKLSPFVMQVYPLDQTHPMWVSRRLVENHIWEAEETYLVLALLNHCLKQQPEGLLKIANIGANIGWYTITSALWDQRITVDAFEPTPETMQLLENNVQINQLQERVSLFSCALSDEIGECSLFVNSNDAGSNSLMANNDSEYTQLENKIHMDTLDNVYLNQERSTWPCLMIVDVEGHEQKVFDGAKELFNQGFRPVLVTEFSPALLKLRGNCSYYKDLITKYSYTPYVLGRDPKQLSSTLIQSSLEMLEQNYHNLADPKLNPDCKFLNVLFAPQGFDLQQVKAVV